MPGAASPLLPWIPDELMRPAAFELALWQWIALPIAFVIALVVGLSATWILRAFLRRIVRATAVGWDDALIERTRAPLWLLSSTGIATLSLPFLDLPVGFEGGLRRLLVAIASWGLFWLFFSAVDIVAGALAATTWAQDTAASRTLIPIGKRITKVVIAGLAIASALSLLGLPVASVIAGLGVGGLAVALAAQKTFENLLGAFSIGADQPFREGDFIKVDDVTGTVERVGLRSTRIRTLDRTVVTLPNGQIAEKRIESYALRDRIRLHVVLGLLYATTEPQMRAVLAGLEAVVRAHPNAWPDNVLVRLTGFGASALEVEVMCWFQTTDWDEFCRIRTEILLQFMGVVQSAGSAFAFPTRTIQLPGSAPDPRPDATKQP